MHLAPCHPDPAQPTPLQQHPAYAAALGRGAQLLQITDTRPIARVLILRGPFGTASTLRGPTWIGTPDLPTRTRALRSLKLRLLEGEAPDPAHRAAGFHALTTPSHIAEWNLTTDPATRHTNMRGKWRNALRQAQTAPLKIEQRVYNGDPRHPLLILAATQARTRRYKTLPSIFTQNFAAHSPGGARIFTALHQRTPVAHMMFLQTCATITYHIGWTTPQGRAFNAHHLLLTQAADWYASRGAHLMDLGQVDTEAAPGLARFKIGTGATIRPLGGSLLRLF